MSLAKVYVYGCGVCSSSVCAPAEMTREEVEHAVNVLNPTGIDSRWTISPAPTFGDGHPNPCPCERAPARRHYLLRC